MINDELACIRLAFDMKGVNKMKDKQFPEIYKVFYRGIRAAVGAGLAQTILLRPDWSKPEDAGKTLLVAFVAGFIPAFGMWLRDWLDSEMGFDEKSIIAKAMPI